MHTWHRIDFQGNFPENRSISEKANYSTENSGNFRTKSLGETFWKFGWASQGCPPLFSKILGNAVPFATGNFQNRDVCHAMKNSDMNFRNRQLWWMKHVFRNFQEKRTTFPSAAKFLKTFLYMAECFSFQKFNNFRIFLKLALEIFTPFVPCSKFSEFSFERKAPQNFWSNRKLPTSFGKKTIQMFISWL